MAAEQPCEHCGAVLPLGSLLRVDEQGEQVLLCPSCAFAVHTGKGPTARRSAP